MPLIDQRYWITVLTGDDQDGELFIAHFNGVFEYTGRHWPARVSDTLPAGCVLDITDMLGAMNVTDPNDAKGYMITDILTDEGISP